MPEITHIYVRDVDGFVTTLPVSSVQVTDDPKVLVHLRQNHAGELVFDCSSKLFKDSESKLETITLINDGGGRADSKSILVTCNDRATLIPITRITKLLKTPPEFKVGILSDTVNGLVSCSIAFSAAFASDIEIIDTIIVL